MKSTHDIYLCDNCNKKDDMQIHPFLKETITIDNWYKVNKHNKPLKHFCSIKCLYEWSSNKEAEEERE